MSHYTYRPDRPENYVHALEKQLHDPDGNEAVSARSLEGGRDGGMETSASQ